MARHGAHNLIKVGEGERTVERETREELSKVYLERVDGSTGGGEWRTASHIMKVCDDGGDS